MLFIPNMIWVKNKPGDYDKYVQNENRILQVMERIGEGLVCSFAEFRLQERRFRYAHFYFWECMEKRIPYSFGNCAWHRAYWYSFGTLSGA